MVGLSVRLAAVVAVLSAATGARADESESDDAEETSAKADAAKPGGDACIDEDVKADLFAKRKQRTSRDRLFQQTNRHELTLRTGYYASDTFDGVVYTRQAKIGSVPLYTFGIFAFAYGYHMTEDFAVEATAAVTQLTSRGGPELERTFAVLEGRPRTQLMFDADSGVLAGAREDALRRIDHPLRLLHRRRGRGRRLGGVERHRRQRRLRSEVLPG